MTLPHRPRHRGVSQCHRFPHARLEATALVLTFVALAIALASSPGNAQILMQADEIIYDAETESVTARGNVEISEPGWILRADSVTYDPNNDVVGATGAVSLTQEDGTVAFADEVQLAGDLREGLPPSSAKMAAWPP